MFGPQTRPGALRRALRDDGHLTTPQPLPLPDRHPNGPAVSLGGGLLIYGAPSLLLLAFRRD